MLSRPKGYAFLHISTVLLLGLSAMTCMTRAANQPNFILIYCEDLGYSDIGCFGSKLHRTPHVDRMAEQGTKFTSFYKTSGVCSPSRDSLMTGCYPRRVNLHEDHNGSWVLFPPDKKGLHPDKVTVAELLKSAGYATAIVGKWHLGDQPEFLPTRHGFDSYFGIPFSNGMRHDSRSETYQYPPLPLLRDETVIEHVSDILLNKRDATSLPEAFYYYFKDRQEQEESPAMATRGLPSPDKIEALFAEWDRTDSPGVAVGIVYAGEVVLKKGFGMASLEHETVISTASVFDVASVSKQFTAIAIAMLALEGKIDLDDPVRQYIPELHSFDPPVTIRHLVHHTSGLRDWPATLALAGWRMDDVISFDQILRMAFRQRTLNFESGAEYLYSNTGYNLLAEIVTRVTGQSFTEWTTEHLFEPLGMKQTRFHDNHQRVVKNRVDSYAPAHGSFLRQRNALTALGSSSLYSTVDDMLLWIQNFDSGKVGGPDVIKLMLECGRLNNGESIAYAFGQTINNYRGLKVVDHTGSWTGFRACLTRFPDHGLGIVVLSNRSDFNAMKKCRELADLFLEDRLDPPPSASQEPGEPDNSAKAAADQTDTGPSQDLAELAGTYWSPELESAYVLSVKEAQLKARHFVHGEFELKPKSPDTFDGGLWFLRELKIQRDDLGLVSGFRASSHRARNVWFEKRR